MWWYGALLLLHCIFILVLKAVTTDALRPFHLRLAGASGSSVALIWMNSAPKVMESRQINNVYLMVSRTNLQSAGHRVEWNIAIGFMVNLFDPWPWDDRAVGTNISGGFLDELIDIWVFEEFTSKPNVKASLEIYVIMFTRNSSPQFYSWIFAACKPEVDALTQRQQRVGFEI